MELFETDKNVDSKEFLNHAGTFVITKKNYPISSIFRSEAQKIAINHLGLRDIYQLRDRFEGQAYMDNLLLKLSALSILERAMSIDLIDWNALKNDKKTDLSNIKIHGKDYIVIPFFYGSLPIINTLADKPFIFCGIRTGFEKGIVCGILENFSFDDDELFLTKMNCATRKLKKFIGFQFLKNLE